MTVFQGDRAFRQDPATLWQKLSDAAFLVQCIPDGSAEGQPTRDEAHATVRPGFSFVRGTLDVVLRIVAVQEPSFVKIQALSKGVGATSDVEVTLAVSPEGTGSHVDWRAEIKSLGGLLKMVPAGLIRGAAQKVIDDVWAGLEEQLR